MKEDCRLLRMLARSLQNSTFRYLLLLGWVGFLIPTAISAPGLLDHTSEEFSAPPATLAAKADVAMATYFPQLSRSSEFIVLLQSQANCSIVDLPSTANFSRSLIAALSQQQSNLAANASYFSLLDQGFAPALLTGFVSPSGGATFIQIAIKSYITDQATNDFTNWLKDTVDRLKPADLSVGVLGAPLVIIGAIEAGEADLKRMDIIVLPLAFLVFAVLLRSWRLILLPLVVLGVSVAATFGSITWIATVTPIYITTPSIMMSILIAMVLDYGLFLLTRFKEEIGRGETVEVACEEMLGTAGMTISISGLTLQAAFLSLLFFPLSVISSMGLGCALALMMTLLANLTLIPALILTFPSFFAPSTTTDTLLEDPLGPMDVVSVEAPKEGVWWKIAEWTTSWWWSVAVVVGMTALVAPVAWQIVYSKTTDAFTVEIARGSDLLGNFEAMSAEFGAGFLTPYTLLITPQNSSMNVLSKEFFETSATAISYLTTLDLYQTSALDFQSAMFARGEPVQWLSVKACLNSTGAPCAPIRYALDTFLNPEHTAAFVTITLTWDPLDQHGSDWLRTLRAGLDVASSRYGLNLWLAGVAADSLDGIQTVYDVLPTMIGSTFGCVLVLVGFAFRTPMVPVRTLFSVILTLGWVYGLASWIYVSGGLDFLQFYGLQGQGALEWVIPVISFPIIVGLALDYDIFLLARVAELRDQGFSDIDAIRHGLAKTGHIITTAGVIMAIAFSGLIFSSMPSCNQLSFFLVGAVTFDTFGVRTFLQPALMAILGSAHWWPRKRPHKIIE